MYIYIIYYMCVVHCWVWYYTTLYRIASAKKINQHCLHVCRYRRGFLDRLNEHIAVTALTWAVLIPLIIFQSLLSVRDSNFSSSPASVHPTATETFMPLLVVLALGFLFSVLLAFAFKSAYQVIVCNFIMRVCMYIFTCIRAICLYGIHLCRGSSNMCTYVCICSSSPLLFLSFAIIIII